MMIEEQFEALEKRVQQLEEIIQEIQNKVYLGEDQAHPYMLAEGKLCDPGLPQKWRGEE